MDLFEEEELVDDTRAKLVHYEEDTVQTSACGRGLDLVRSNVEVKESEGEFYAGRLVSRSQLTDDSSPETEVDSELGEH